MEFFRFAMAMMTYSFFVTREMLQSFWLQFFEVLLTCYCVIAIGKSGNQSALGTVGD